MAHRERRAIEKWKKPHTRDMGKSQSRKKTALFEIFAPYLPEPIFVQIIRLKKAGFL
jgi:hypothetical protein